MCKPSAISECPECPGHRHGPVRSHSIPPNRDRSPRVRPRPGPSTRISDSCSGLLPISRLTSSLPTSSFPPPSLPPSVSPYLHPTHALHSWAMSSRSLPPSLPPLAAFRVQPVTGTAFLLRAYILRVSLQKSLPCPWLRNPPGRLPFTSPPFP